MQQLSFKLTIIMFLSVSAPDSKYESSILNLKEKNTFPATIAARSIEIGEAGLAR